VIPSLRVLGFIDCNFIGILTSLVHATYSAHLIFFALNALTMSAEGYNCQATVDYQYIIGLYLLFESDCV
jgi:hypothetical protein